MIKRVELMNVEHKRAPHECLSFEVRVDGIPFGTGDMWLEEEGVLGGWGPWLDDDDVVDEVEHLANLAWEKIQL